jgi:tRNA threonylcarbamoyladenosine biosynthesis protein TsaB
MKVVAVDTATAFGSVALVEDDALLGEVRLEGAQSSSTRLLPAVDSLLDRLGLGVGDLDGFGVAIGPGSYTGLRVGIGSVQGLAFASGKRCAGVCVLDALARRMRGSATMLVPLMDAYRHEVYAARYDRDARPLSDPVAREPAAFVSELPDSPAFLGDGAG